MNEDLFSPKKLEIKKMIGDYIIQITNSYEPTLINDILSLKPTTLKKIRRGETSNIELKMMRERFASGLLRDRFRGLIKKEDRVTLRAFVDNDYLDLLRLKGLEDEENQKKFKEIAEKKLYEYLEANRYDFSVRLCSLLAKKGVVNDIFIRDNFPPFKGMRIIEDLEERGIVEFDKKTQSYFLVCNFHFSHIPSLETKFLRDVTENCLDSSDTDRNDLIAEYYIGYVTKADYRKLTRDHKMSFDEKIELATDSENKKGSDIPVLLLQACVSLGKKIEKEELLSRQTDSDFDDREDYIH